MSANPQTEYHPLAEDDIDEINNNSDSDAMAPPPMVENYDDPNAGSNLPPIQSMTQDQLDSMPEYMRNTAMLIEEFDRYCKENPDGGYMTGMEQLDDAIIGFQPGLHFVAGMSNAGKSSFLLNLAWKVAHNNDDAYALYITLDDGTNDLLPRIVAMEQQVPINTARYPGRYTDFDDLIETREEGIRILYDNVDKFGIMNKDYGWPAENLEELVKEYRMQLAASGSDRDLCIFIDNFHDLSSEKVSIGTDQNARFEQAGGALKNISETYDVPIIATAEYKKLEGKSRPVISDIKQTGKTIYQAKTVMLCYNEVGVKDEMAKVYFAREERDRKSPIFEVHIAKNKSSDMKSRLFYEFYEEMARFEEVPKTQSGHYLNMLGG